MATRQNDFSIPRGDLEPSRSRNFRVFWLAPFNNSLPNGWISGAESEARYTSAKRDTRARSVTICAKLELKTIPFAFMYHAPRSAPLILLFCMLLQQKYVLFHVDDTTVIRYIWTSLHQHFTHISRPRPLLFFGGGGPLFVIKNVCTNKTKQQALVFFCTQFSKKNSKCKRVGFHLRFNLNSG